MKRLFVIIAFASLTAGCPPAAPTTQTVGYRIADVKELQGDLGYVEKTLTDGYEHGLLTAAQFVGSHTLVENAKAAIGKAEITAEANDANADNLISAAQAQMETLRQKLEGN